MATIIITVRDGSEVVLQNAGRDIAVMKAATLTADDVGDAGWEPPEWD